MMTELPIIEIPSTKPATWQSNLATAGRCALVALLALAFRFVSGMTAENVPQSAPLTIEDVLSAFPDAMTVDEPSSSGLQEVLNGDANTLGVVCQTLPQSESVVGYRGPSNVMLVLDKDGVVQSARLLSSDDTPEHVDAIKRDESFFPQFRGWTMGDATTFDKIDATSGATLTALAIAESVAVRLGSERPSLRFPDEFDEEDLTFVFGSVEDVMLIEQSSFYAQVLNRKTGSVVAHLYRTGTLVDSINGYQGPGEVLVVTDVDDTVLRLRLRRTFDNMPYAGYLNEEDYFWSVFQNRKFVDLRNLDLEAEQVEGVSGATMTSMAIAETIVAAAKALHQKQQQPKLDASRSFIQLGKHDVGTFTILMIALLIGTTRLRGVRWIQVTWLLLLIGYFGLVTGNLISLAVLVGWASKGFAWQLAPGLFCVLAVSLLVPPFTKRNIYCTHVCPHGAVQQILRRLPLPRWRLNARFRKSLKFVPGITLIAAAVCTLAGVAVNLASWEPFNAWIWFVAGRASLILAGASFVVSAFVPMAWCRYGCATGRFLEYLRHSARSARVTLADVMLVLLVVIAWGWISWSQN